MPRFINLDYQSTTPPEPLVLKELLAKLEEGWANPAAPHAKGQRADAILESARRRVGRYIGVPAADIVFTAGATESNNLAIKGVAHARVRGHLITAATEHKSVLACFDRLRRDGFETTVLPVSRAGHIDLDQLRDAIRPDTVLGSFMLVNNEIGVVHPLRQIADILHERGALLHSDATQGLPNMRVRPRTLGVDLMSASAHKFYAPKGVGILYCDHDSVGDQKLLPEVEGGGQEGGVRSGTVNVPAISATATAINILDENLEQDIADNLEKRTAFQASLPPTLGVTVNGSDRDFVPAILSLTLGGIEAATVMERLDHLLLSTGSACSAASRSSHVLAALGLTPAEIRCTLRVGFGRFTSLAEVKAAAESFGKLV